jgi:nitric-oxide synthase, bacterial
MDTAASGCPVNWVANLADAPAKPAYPSGGPNPREVREFFEQYRDYTEMSQEAFEKRVAEVMAEILATGTYTHTSDELTVGAKLAWYNHTRCIGKLYWRSLTVRDCRHVTDAEGIRDECFEHQRVVHNGGRIKPTITIFAPDAPGKPAPRLRNGQLVAYAGYKQADGGVLGDGGATEVTELALAAGWTPPAERTPFDVLPLILESPEGELTVHDVPRELVWEIDIEHPSYPALADLGLKWYGFPSIANMGMTIGGITYPTSPFTGWYVAPELSARDFSDEYRYNLLPQIAEAFGIDTSDRRSLWKDRATIELTTAVLHSYDKAGMRMDDHHTATEKFHKWTQAEAKRGRTVDAEWTWMIPPISASLTPVFHETYRNEERLPNFVRVERPVPAAAAPCPVTGARAAV